MSLKIEDRNDERSVSEFSHFFRYSMVTSLSQKIADLRSNGRIPLLLSTDDTALLVQSSTAAATSLSSFSEAASILGLRISWPKTKLQNIGADTQPSTYITVDDNRVECVEGFVYLGSAQSSDGQCLSDVKRRIALASSVMASLKRYGMTGAYHCPSKSEHTKHFFSPPSCMLQTWTLHAKDARILQSFHMKCQRQILSIR